MKIKIHDEHINKVAEIISNDVVIRTVQDALDLIADADDLDTKRIILREKNFSPNFYNLKTGFAGEVLQKFSNYSVKIAIIGNFSTIECKNFRAFISESNRGKQVFFTESLQTAIEKLAY